MPSATFFRLPEEKRMRLVEAAWNEFSQVRFGNVSINRIIQTAHIPRGSFYQYFEDKSDLFDYLLEDVREQFKQVLAEILTEERGSLYRLSIRAFDVFMEEDGTPFPLLGRFVTVLKTNPGLDLRVLLSDQPGVLPPCLMELVDRSGLRRQEDSYLNSIFSLVVGCLAGAIMETLCRPEQRDFQRSLLEERIEIIRLGSFLGETAPVGKEET